MKKLRLLTAIGAMLMLLTAATTSHTTTIFIIGDSTAANKEISGGRQERGWGMALQCYFDDNIVVDNHAVNGRSSLSFLNEGRWNKVLEKIRPGDYVIIQFGHNDEKPKADRHTDPGSTFDYNLARYVRETREKGGIPVLMNSVVRRNFPAPPQQAEGDKGGLNGIDDDEKLRTTTFKDGGNMGEGDSLTDTHGLYRVAPRDVARRMNCHFVDANAITHELEQGLGREESKRLHMWFRPGEEPSVPNGRQDNTHYNVYGAHVVARLLADALCQEIPVLSRFRTEADITIDREGRGDYLSIDEALKHVDALKPVTIQLLGGEWTKPALPKKTKVQFVMRMGAKWKE